MNAKLAKYGAVALLALGLGFGAGLTAATEEHAPTLAETRALAKVQAGAPDMACWLKWDDAKQVHEVACRAEVAKGGGNGEVATPRKAQPSEAPAASPQPTATVTVTAAPALPAAS